MDKKLCHTIRLLKLHAQQYKQSNNKALYMNKRIEIDNQEYALYSLYNQIILGTSVDDYITKINHVGKIVHNKKKFKYFPTTNRLQINRYGEMLYINGHSKYIVEPPVFLKGKDTIQDKLRFNEKKNIVRSDSKDLYYIRFLMEMLKEECI